MVPLIQPPTFRLIKNLISLPFQMCLPRKRITPLWRWETLRTNLEGAAAYAYALLLNETGSSPSGQMGTKSAAFRSRFNGTYLSATNEKLHESGLWHGKKGTHIVEGEDIIDARGAIKVKRAKPSRSPIFLWA